ncbi:hypothetical protein RI103_06370 [Paraburkholderia sp. FT54]|uniref:hypothetical protein n=1 Tax=Paraburkholderia sp. FT54 TaxID=3074437 RepID=UPI0028775AF7|nr:hypothetical protein [Paraburkholderia sp. FT54]WNC90972.1 hypothetical protein RI103_06370 [Paraburkholderia sp. FT54]
MEAKDMLSLPDDEFRAHVVEYLVVHDAAIAENTAVTRNVATTANQVAEDTALIRSILSDVAAGARFMCRLAAAWRFFQKQVFIPIVLPVLGLYGLWFYTQFHRFPGWLADCFKFLMAAL